MRSLREFKGTRMQWIQPRAMVRHHELWSAQELYASLDWVQLLGSLAEASTADGTFTLKRGGFLLPYVTIREKGSDADLAVLSMGMFRHGTLEFPNGRKISLLSTRFWRLEWDLVDENGLTLCTISMNPTILKHSADVTISEIARRDRDLLLMVVIGWYTMVLVQQERAAASSSAAGSY